MSGIPECLNRRYKALDDLIRELTMVAQNPSQLDPGIKLMCNFWNILKDDPYCNLTEQVQQCFLPSSENDSYYSYSTNSSSENPKPFKHKYNCLMCQDPSSNVIHVGHANCTAGGAGGGGPSPSNNSRGTKGCAPLAGALTNLQKAAHQDTTCRETLKELLEAQKQLQCEITCLEKKEKEGVQLMKQADQMWASMEKSYRDKISESLERQKQLKKQLHDIETSANKWRKNKKDLELQLQKINKCQLEMVAKLNQKTNDAKTIQGDIAAHNKRIAQTKKETEATKAALVNKKKLTDGRIAQITLEISTMEKQIREEAKKKIDKELAGKAYIQEARIDLQNICKILLQRRLEHEDIEAEKTALLQEINLLNETCAACKDKCAKKQSGLDEEIRKTDVDIANYRLQCVKCNTCVDSADARTLCNDCPRCKQLRQCLIEGEESCKANAEEECVCSTIKPMFLNNIFENMAMVLEKKIKTNTAKALGDEILKCLRKSRNGKLTDRLKGLLREFVLQTVKKNLNLTIVGGAIKTRCEMDPAMYKQLMLCLQQVKPTPAPSKSDKGCDVKKDPCSRWGGPGECNCRLGPNNCICSKKAVPSIKNPSAHPPEPTAEEPGEKEICPHKKEPCGTDCAAHSVSRIGAEVAEFRPDPCSGQTCSFGKNMRAAQCVLGSEPLLTTSKSAIEKVSSKGSANLPGTSKDVKTVPRELMIEEVMGGFMDVEPIKRVSHVGAKRRSDLFISEKRTNYYDCYRANETNTNIKTDSQLITYKITQTSSDLDQDGLTLLWPKLHLNAVEEQSQNDAVLMTSDAHESNLQSKHLSTYSKDNFGHNTRVSSVKVSVSEYLEAISSNDLRAAYDQTFCSD